MKYLDVISIDQLPDQCHKLKLLLVTATTVENRAVVESFQPLPGFHQVHRLLHRQYTYHVGLFGAYVAAHLQCAAGSIRRDSSAIAVRDALELWQPKAVIMVGIAFGRDSSRQALGDVLIAESVALYEPAKLRGGRSAQRGPILQAGKVLINRFRNHEEWSLRLPGEREAKVHVGQLLTGEKLVDDSRAKSRLFDAYPHAIGGEMEGAGLSSACDSKGIEWVIVKAIADWADGTKSDAFQEDAALSAVALCKHVLESQTALAALAVPPVDV